MGKTWFGICRPCKTAEVYVLFRKAGINIGEIRTQQFIDIILTDNHDDTWGQYGGTEEFTKTLRLRKHLDRMEELFRNAGLSADTYYQWECVDVDSVQNDFLVLTSKYNREYNTADEAGKAAIRDAGFAMAEKMRKYDLSINEGTRSPKFDSPDQVTIAPSIWKTILNSDGTPIFQED